MDEAVRRPSLTAMSCATRNWGKGMCCSALDCRQGSELYAVLPWMQVNRTLNMTPDKVQEQSQEVVASKQGFVC